MAGENGGKGKLKKEWEQRQADERRKVTPLPCIFFG